MWLMAVNYWAVCLFTVGFDLACVLSRDHRLAFIWRRLYECRNFSLLSFGDEAEGDEDQINRTSKVSYNSTSLYQICT